MDESSAFDKVVNGIKDVAGIVGEIYTLIKGGGDIEGQIQQLSELTQKMLVNSLAMVQLEHDLRNKARMLEERLKEVENWEKEKERYELKSIRGGRAFAYVLKANEKGKCLFCPTCFENRKKRILQPTIAKTLECSECGMNIYP